MYYFAYGSNMEHKQMQKRCPNSKYLMKAQLQGYKFVYDGYSETRGCAVANIVKDKDNIVWGGLFEVTDECIKMLDKYEGVPTAYQKKTIEVRDEQNNLYKAIVYLREPQKVGRPSDGYRKILIDGAKDCGLPEEYVEKFIKI